MQMILKEMEEDRGNTLIRYRNLRITLQAPWSKVPGPY